jgi:OTU-like cysteine protease
MPRSNRKRRKEIKKNAVHPVPAAAPLKAIITNASLKVLALALTPPGATNLRKFKTQTTASSKAEESAHPDKPSKPTPKREAGPITLPEQWLVRTMRPAPIFYKNHKDVIHTSAETMINAGSSLLADSSQRADVVLPLALGLGAIGALITFASRTLKLQLEFADQENLYQEIRAIHLKYHLPISLEKIIQLKDEYDNAYITMRYFLMAIFALTLSITNMLIKSLVESIPNKVAYVFTTIFISFVTTTVQHFSQEYVTKRIGADMTKRLSALLNETNKECREALSKSTSDEATKAKILPTSAPLLNLGLRGRIVNVHGDGNCFFHAIAHEMARQLETVDYQTLRALGVAWLRGNRQIFAAYPSEHGTQEAYLDRMACDKTWAEGAIIEALPKALNIHLRIYEVRDLADDSHGLNASIIDINAEEGHRATITLIRYREHYQVLEPNDIYAPVAINVDELFPPTKPTLAASLAPFFAISSSLEEMPTAPATPKHP